MEQRHYTRENRLLLQSRKSLVMQERMYFRNLPLSDWIEHEILLEDGADVDRLVQRHDGLREGRGQYRGYTAPAAPTGLIPAAKPLLR